MQQQLNITKKIHDAVYCLHKTLAGTSYSYFVSNLYMLVSYKVSHIKDIEEQLINNYGKNNLHSKRG